MINWRRKNFNNPPAQLYSSVRQTAGKEAERLLDGDQIKGNHYNFDSIVILLKAYSLDQDTFDDSTELAKCYYCESTSEVVASLEVEHYRPKKRIDDENRKQIPGTNGYYWLGIEWSNLVLACSNCNGRGGKGNIFTIKGTRINVGTTFNGIGAYDRTTSVSDQSPLIDENPDLLHPEIDNAYNFLRFNSNGEIRGKWRKGRRTVQICKLDRKELDIARKNLIDQFNVSFWEVIGWHKDKHIFDSQLLPLFTSHCKKLRKRHNRKETYTLLVEFMIKEFEDFFVKKVPLEYQNILRQAFLDSM